MTSEITEWTGIQWTARYSHSGALIPSCEKGMSGDHTDVELETVNSFIVHSFVTGTQVKGWGLAPLPHYL